MGGGRNFERPNVERLIFRNLKITGEGQNFEQSNFRIADVSYLKINERSNVERPTLRE